MPGVTGPRGGSPIRPMNAKDIGQTDGPGSAVGTFKPAGWGVTSPLRQLTLSASGDFSATLRGGGKASGRFEFRDGAAAFMDTLKLTGADGKALLFAVSDAKKDAQGTISELKLAPITDRGVGLPFTLRLE
ncbi:MAG: hypothetical protein SFW67_08885 [Myxococcaceae bacterium]|nr:hypothetical protein [Myxococcaceae bacterium]